MITHALRYASIGWHVLPIYEMTPQGCSCGKVDCNSPGKHPRTKHGLVDASKDEAKITEWWSKWPNANIAVATGATSGIIVIDIDGPEGEKSMEGHPYPPTIEALTGGGGRHLIYAHPGGCSVKSGTGILPKVDSRADGGYIVVAPSNHKSGVDYEWRSPPWGEYETAAPDWWLNLLVERKPKTQTAGTVIEGGRNNYITQYAGRLRRSAGFEYDELLSAVSYHNDRTCSPPLPMREVEQICKSIAGYAVFTEEEERQIAKGDKSAKALIANLEADRQKALKNKKVTVQVLPPKNFVPDSGIVREVYNWIIETSRYPLPYLAMAASLCFVSTLVGRRYASHTGLRPNLYMIGLAGSGEGKDHARSCIGDLIHACGMSHVMGGAKIASGAALVSAVEESPVKLYQIDEIGIMLQMLFDKNAGGHKKELAELLMELYTTKNYAGTDYADRKIKKQTQILEPFVTVYGTSTPDEFYKAISSGSAASGFLNRMLFITDKRTEKCRDKVPCKPPAHLVESIKSFYASIHGELDASLTGAHVPEIIRIGCPKDIADSWEDLDDFLFAEKYDEGIKPIYTRVPATVMKIATIFSLSRGSNMITHEDYQMAREITLWSTSLIVDGMIHNVADNETERKAKKLATIIKSAGEITKSKLIEKTRWLEKWERDNFLQDLLEAENIDVLQITGVKKPSILIKWTI